MKRNIAHLLVATAAFALLYATGVNRNLFYLMFSWTCIGLVIALSDGLVSRVAALVALLFASAVTVAHPLPRRVNLQAQEDKGLKAYPVDKPLRFRFTLSGLDERTADCGPLTPIAIVVGQKLESLNIAANGTKVAPPKITPVFDRQIAVITLPDATAKAVDLEIVPTQEVRILQAPEVIDRDVYPDAVYLRYANTKCHVVYHARKSDD